MLSELVMQIANTGSRFVEVTGVKQGGRGKVDNSGSA